MLTAVKHYLLFYEAAPGYVERRAAFRNEHLEKAWTAHELGELVLGGALAAGPAAVAVPVAEPVDGAVLLFRAESPDAVEAFAKADPYVVHGLVSRWYVREWTTVVGCEAATPLRPA